MNKAFFLSLFEYIQQNSGFIQWLIRKKKKKACSTQLSIPEGRESQWQGEGKYHLVSARSFPDARLCAPWTLRQDNWALVSAFLVNQFIGSLGHFFFLLVPHQQNGNNVYISFFSKVMTSFFLFPSPCSSCLPLLSFTSFFFW